jgi:transcriptional regulator with XRE-family HTH domain
MDAAAMLRMARRRAQLSQRELARRAGVPQATISRIENRVVSPTLDTLDPLIRACGMQLGVVDERGVDVDRSQIRERLAMAPSERLRLAVDAANGVRELRRAFGFGRPA